MNILIIAVMVVTLLDLTISFKWKSHHIRSKLFSMVNNNDFNQGHLEATPYWDNSNIPMQLFKPKEPCVGKIVSVKKIVGEQAIGDVYEVVIDHGGKMPYWEGQSYGVIPPGINPKNNKPYINRLYSIASTRYGDDLSGRTTTFCVRRATFVDPETGKEDPEKAGLCSNYLCSAKAGDEVQLIGPAGRVMLLHEKNPATDIIMVATGTGVAPYRGFVRRLFVEDNPAAKHFAGLAWLFLGVPNSNSLLYDELWKEVKTKRPDNFRFDYALSREQSNKKGGKMYVQDKMEEHADELYQRMDNGAHIYFCGLKGMMPGILQMLQNIAERKGLNWTEVLKGWKTQGQWHVEVY